jgi:hypothetical protein
LGDIRRCHQPDQCGPLSDAMQVGRITLGAGPDVIGQAGRTGETQAAEILCLPVARFDAMPPALQWTFPSAACMVARNIAPPMERPLRL